MPLPLPKASQVVLAVKNSPAIPETPETRVRPLGQENLLEQGMAAHSSALAWRTPWTGAWRAVVHGVAQNQTQLTTLTHTSSWKSVLAPAQELTAALPLQPLF